METKVQVHPSVNQDGVRSWHSIQFQEQRSHFMANPPPCSAIIAYHPSNPMNAKFLFKAADVASVANAFLEKQPDLEGMVATNRWASLHDSSTHPTNVHELLINFDQIAERLIEVGMGEVHCGCCNITYPTTQLARRSEQQGGYFYANYVCPANHSVLLREVMHVMFRRNP